MKLEQNMKDNNFEIKKTLSLISRQFNFWLVFFISIFGVLFSLFSIVTYFSIKKKVHKINNDSQNEIQNMQIQMKEKTTEIQKNNTIIEQTATNIIKFHLSFSVGVALTQEGQYDQAIDQLNNSYLLANTNNQKLHCEYQIARSFAMKVTTKMPKEYKITYFSRSEQHLKSALCCGKESLIFMKLICIQEILGDLGLQYKYQEALEVTSEWLLISDKNEDALKIKSRLWNKLYTKKNNNN